MRNGRKQFLPLDFTKYKSTILIWIVIFLSFFSHAVVAAAAVAATAAAAVATAALFFSRISYFPV